MLFVIATWYVTLMTTPGKFVFIWKIERSQINAIESGRTQIHHFGDVFLQPPCHRRGCISFFPSTASWRRGSPTRFLRWSTRQKRSEGPKRSQGLRITRITCRQRSSIVGIAKAPFWDRNIHKLLWCVGLVSWNLKLCLQISHSLFSKLSINSDKLWDARHTKFFDVW